ncbi:hypothetical protein UMZ34_02490 [Halopseudomonas pachastrellae]|nr:hypothetical protein UMZ34_02490 [Halopseudomonas pachastrellae]
MHAQQFTSLQLLGYVLGPGQAEAAGAVVDDRQAVDRVGVFIFVVTIGLAAVIDLLDIAAAPLD